MMILDDNVEIVDGKFFSDNTCIVDDNVEICWWFSSTILEL